MEVSGRVDKRGAGAAAAGLTFGPKFSLGAEAKKLNFYNFDTCYGDTSHVFVALNSGGTLSAIFQNEARSAEPAVQIGQELWCSWGPRDTLILGN